MSKSDYDHEFAAELITTAEHKSFLERQVHGFNMSRYHMVGKNIARYIRDPKKYTPKAIRLAKKQPTKLISFATGKKQVAPVDYAKETDDQYQVWIKQNTLSPTEIKYQIAESKKLKYRPLISIITPVFKPPIDVFEELLKSVLGQTYDNFELCIGEFSQSDDIKKVLDKYVKKDKRIVVKYFDENERISKNSNKIFEFARGDFIALLDHDDLLTPDALFENVKLLNDKELDLIYSDKDKIDNDGNRFDPIFKPKYSPELMLCANYLTHFDVIRSSLIKEIGGWDPTTDGAQDWDLFLRVARNTDRIEHIPKILYHWRTVETSTAVDMSAKPYALEAQRRAVKKQLDYENLDATPMHDYLTRMYIKWNNNSQPSVVIHARYKERLKERIDEIQNYKWKHDIQWYLVHADLDLAGIDQSLFNEVFDFQPGELAEKFNEVVEHIEDEVVFIRDTIQIEKNFEEVLLQSVGWLDIKGVLASAPRIDDSDGVITGAGRVFGLTSAFGLVFCKTAFYNGGYGSFEWIRNFIGVNKKLICTSVENLNSLGGFNIDLADHEIWDELFLKGYDAGMRCVYDPLHSVIDEMPTNLELDPSPAWLSIIKKHKNLIKNGDPFYNKNLNTTTLFAEISLEEEGELYAGGSISY